MEKLNKSEIDLDDIIQTLTNLLIQQDFKDKEKGKSTYVKKTRIYADLIKWFKQIEKHT